jgi:membrane protease YdiL (CAAX protease family)/5-hydroxyisourate hydrolase-like protein (transthyretin family)
VHTTITATAAPPQQVVWRDVTITGQLTADGAGIANALIKLYRDVDGLWTGVGTTTTSESGGFTFQIQQASPGTSHYKAAYQGDGTHARAQSAEIAVTFVTIPTTITAKVAPLQQSVGRDVTITGQLTADGTPVAEASVTLYNADDAIELVSVDTTTTDAAGDYQFTLTDTAPSQHAYVVRYQGDGTHSRAQSAEMVITYVTIPTTITATVVPLQQSVGRDVTITGTLTADGTPVSEASVILYNADDVKRVSVSTTATDAAGDYQFTLTDTAPSQHAYVVRYQGDGTHSRAQSAEMVITYVTIPTTITATATPRQQVVGRDVTISGRLTADGTPVSEASVILYNADDAIELVPVSTTATDAAGDYQFTLADTASSQHAYVVRYPGTAAYEPSPSAEMVITYVTIPTTITATATPRQQVVGRNVIITGTLTADGTPVSEASVTLYNADDVKGVSVATTATDAAGDYQFTLTDTAPSQHAYVVRYQGDGTHARAQSAEMVVTYVTIPTTITATATPRQQVVGRNVIITGTLTAEGAGLAAVPLTLYKTDAAEDFHVAATTTDAAGDYQFTLTDTAPSQHAYVVRYPGTAAYEPSPSAEMVITFVTIPTTITATATSLQQVVGRDVTISGTLTADGTSVADASVALCNADDAIERVPEATTTTDSAGFFQFTLTGTAPGSHTYVVRYPGAAAYELSESAEMGVTYVTIPTTITATVVPLQQSVGRDVTISGTLTADGTSVADASVALCNADDITELVPIATTATGAAGDYQFILTDAAPGHHTYAVRYQGDSTHSRAQSAEMVITFVTIPTTITATVVPLQQSVGRDVTITGTLTADGTPVSEASVTLYNADDVKGVPVSTTATDAAGDYQFTLTDTASSQHAYVVRYQGDSTHARAQSAEIVVTYVTIPTTITATATPLQQVVGRDVTITGRLTADGAGLATKRLTIYQTEAVENFHIATTTTDAAGDYQFTLANPVPGRHTYVVRYPGAAAYELSVSPEIAVTYVTIPTTITAKVAPRHQFVGRDVTITGTLTAEGTPISEASVTLSNADDAEGVPVATTATDAAGYYQFTLSNTSAGQHAYVVRYPGDAVHETSVSAEKVATYITTPTTITVTASPQKQVVGRDVIISGRRLLPDGGRVAATPLTLYKTDATERVPVATTTTDDYGYYQFTSIDTVATTHVYTVCAEADSTYSSAQSTELLVTYTSLPTAAAAKVRLALNLAWYEILSILLIIAGEGLFFAGYRIADVGVQALNIIVVAVIVVALHGQRVKLVEVLALVSVFRVVNLSFALVPTTTLYWLITIYGVMYVPIVALIVHCKMSRSDLGLTGGVRLAYLIPAGALIGTVFGLVEYRILANSALIPSLSLLSLIELSIVMIFFVGFVEELLFRSLLQQSFVQRSGAVVGILITSIIFAVMHAGYANGYELLFTFGAGLVLGFAFYKTKNLPFVVTINAVGNILLFGVLPFLLAASH